MAGTDRPTLRRPLTRLVPAVLAAAALLIASPSPGKTQAHPIRTTAARAWPAAQGADVPGTLADGQFFQPLLFTDATTSVGTAPTADGAALRLLVRDAGGSLRQLRRLPTADEPQFDQVTTDGAALLWTQSSDRYGLQIWTAPLRGAQPARLLTAHTGEATFYGNQYDLVVTAGRVYWTAATADTTKTEIRSVALTGGPVQVRTVPGAWSLSAWPWLTDDSGNQSPTTRLLNLNTGQETTVAVAGSGVLTCSPVWCRAMVMNGAGLDHIDLVHPDGTGRRRIAGGGAQAAVTDVAVLDRFEILSEPGPDSDLSGTAGLLVYDLSTGNTVDLSAAAEATFTRNGVVWWSTGDQETTHWHSLDLRTA